MVTMALSAVDNTIVATAIPQVVRDLGGFSLFSWVFSAYLLTQTVSIPIYGKLADQWGRKPILIAGTIIFLAGSALCAASWDMVSLICFRGLQGLGAGSIMATVNTLAGDLYRLEERGRVQGWLSSVWGISAVFGPTLGGSLAQYASWRWIFLINLPLGAAAIAMIARYLHERVSRTRHRIDTAGAATLLLAAGALMFGLLQGGVAWPWLSPPSIAVFAVAAMAAVAAVFVERRAAEPILPPWLWRRRALSGSGLCALGMGLGLLSVCTVVGPQSIVGWNQRGVVTGSVMFCRYLGQSLGAAIFGAIFNSSLNASLRGAPAQLRGRLPHNVSGVSATIGHTASLGPAAGYLRDAISAATHDVYAGLSIAALATIAVILIIPRHMAEASASGR